MLRFIAALAWICAVLPAKACDVCGCSASGFSSGFTMLQNRHFAGFGYTSRAFQSEHPTLFDNEVPKVSRERFHTLQAQGRYFPLPNLQLMAFVPYHFFERDEGGTSSHTQGWGDAILTAHFVLLGNPDSGAFGQRLSAGGGVKLPTGRNNLETGEDAIVIPNMQPGTGSLDYLVNIAYLAQWKRWGVNTEVSYRWNRPNDRYYAFGDRFNASLMLYRNIPLGKGEKVFLRPEAGCQADHAQLDNQNTRTNDWNTYSGGYLLEARLGLSAAWNNFLGGFTLSRPLRQYLGAGYITSRPQVNVQFNYLIQKK